MSKLVQPHGGGSLKPLLVPEIERRDELKRAGALKKVPMTSRETSDVIMLAMGAYTPLDGFMGKADWEGVCSGMKMTDGLFWPIPITLSATKELADSIQADEEVALVDAETGEIMAVMQVSEKYEIDKAFECQHVYRTTDPAHPGVQKVMGQGQVNLAGRVSCLSEGEYPEKYKGLYLRPAESRALFAEKGWSKVAAFQTRNPMHRSHEHLAKIAVEVTDGVFIHQVLGKLKDGDIPAETRTKAIGAMIDNYFVPGTVIQAGYPIEMRYGGPREALIHALIRQNFGCSHLIVGRDHAGVGDYYGPFDAQHIFDTLWPGALETQALKIDITFFCKKCYGMATAKTCPHGKEDQVNISGTKQREMLSKGEHIPPEFSRPEVVAILRDYYASLGK
ncbi:sulfate adenylyltransferase [Magnetospirillum moscoviense]|uniref:Sulfate adenylyltransferase n=1 Tax=Magnetospirillum moscoviense TaxID=1437059 RepID=A0A178MGZ8_9PROT|nr:sulfate adenylyltransferase [Magnetospirillum moscoviense]MBF0325215.1 sulfate adenylyltransferase [Alphaproteobacteria bacterium]OAN47936.1 sulfate adenylyltransferase [Magnetospirillum moscoviense]